MKKVARSNLIPASSRLMDNSMVRFASALKEEKTGAKKIADALKNFLFFKVKGFNPKSVWLRFLKWKDLDRKSCIRERT